MVTLTEDCRKSLSRSAELRYLGACPLSRDLWEEDATAESAASFLLPPSSHQPPPLQPMKCLQVNARSLGRANRVD